MTDHQTGASLQEAVNDVVDGCFGWRLEDAMAAMDEALSRRGRPAQPRRWVEAVAAAAIEGRTYVVSDQALADTGTDVPERRDLEASPGRDRGHDPV